MTPPSDTVSPTPGEPSRAEPGRTAGHPSTADTTITFPDAPRLELERTIVELTARAQEVLSAQGRLRALLRANAVVTGELELPTLLGHVVAAARELARARHAVLGVVGHDGAVREVVHDGLDTQTAARVRPPLHPDDLVAVLAGRSPGFRDGGGFLDVPVLVGDELFGHLWLAAHDDRFTPDDGQLVLSLAATAGTAIANARLFRDAERRRRWQAAATEATQRLFSVDDRRPIEIALHCALDGADADFAVFSRADGDGPRADAFAGALDHELVAGHPALNELADAALSSGESSLVRDADGPGPPDGPASARMRVGSLIAAPLHGHDGAVGVVVIGRRQGRAPFDETDLDQLVHFAGHTGVALQLDRARADRESVAVLRERDRLASNLHDDVIRDLFATGMGLLSLAQQADDPAQRDRLSGYVDTLDEIILRIRRAVSQQPGEAGDGTG